MAKTDSTTQIFYIYRHVRHDTNEVFYIGKGTWGKPMTVHHGYARAFTTRRNNPLWQKVAAKTTYDVEIVMEFDDEATCFAKEHELVALYGRKDLGEGTLCNLTDGGEGTFRFPVTEEMRQQMSARLTGNSFRQGIPHTPETKDLLRKLMRGAGNGHYGKRHTEDAKRRMGDARRGRPGTRLGAKATPEQKQRMSKAQKGKHHTEAAKRKMSLSRTGADNAFFHKTHSQESRAKMSATLKRLYAETGTHSWIGRKHSEESKQKISVARKGKPNLALRGRVHSPEHTRKQAMATKETWRKRKRKMIAEYQPSLFDDD